jgi:hypothetical protein
MVGHNVDPELMIERSHQRIDDKISRAALDLLLKEPFYAHVLCGKPRVVTLAEVAEKCGPIYGPFCSTSFGGRPAGWWAAARENVVVGPRWTFPS